MFHIINTTTLQKEIGKISKKLEKDFFIVNKNGSPKMIILPYKEELFESIEDYMEDLEMLKNSKALENEAKKSLKSGISDLKI